MTDSFESWNKTETLLKTLILKSPSYLTINKINIEDAPNPILFTVVRGIGCLSSWSIFVVEPVIGLVNVLFGRLQFSYLLRTHGDRML